MVCGIPIRDKGNGTDVIKGICGKIIVNVVGQLFFLTNPILSFYVSWPNIGGISSLHNSHAPSLASATCDRTVTRLQCIVTANF